MSYYCIYDTYDKDQCKGVFLSGKELAEYIGNEPCSIYSAISRGAKLRNRYEVVKYEEGV